MAVHFFEIIFSLTLFVVFAASKTEFCKSGAINCSLCNKNEVISRIEDWWQEMSVQKPMKCKSSIYADIVWT